MPDWKEIRADVPHGEFYVRQNYDWETEKRVEGFSWGRRRGGHNTPSSSFPENLFLSAIGYIDTNRDDDRIDADANNT